MSRHDIIDKRRQKLVDKINQILGTTESAQFAVGYFFYGTEGDCDEKFAANKFDSN